MYNTVTTRLPSTEYIYTHREREMGERDTEEKKTGKSVATGNTVGDREGAAHLIPILTFSRRKDKMPTDSEVNHLNIQREATLICAILYLRQTDTSAVDFYYDNERKGMKSRPSMADTPGLRKKILSERIFINQVETVWTCKNKMKINI